MRLGQLLEGSGAKTFPRLPADLEIRGLCDDSRLCGPGELFAALPTASGLNRKAAAYEKEARARGAAGVLRARNPRAAWARVCSNFFGRPSEHMALVGVTGTNGKTTASFLTRSLLQKAGRKSALFGTVVYDLLERCLPASHTTPGPLELSSMLARAQRAGADAAVMEVSSHALEQRRVDGLAFDAAIFTNLTQDHLDYHKTMPAYSRAKARLFGLLKQDGTAVLNADDPATATMAKACPRGARTIRYSASGKKAELLARGLRFGAQQTDFTLYWNGKGHALRLPLPGRFNVANALAAAGAGLALGLSVEAVLRGLAHPEVPPGRFELVRAGQPFQVVVDYAHTPDALERVLAAAREITPGKVLVVFGCGGDRDRGKRPRMGAIAARLADLAIVTSDNPRSEDPEKIIDEIMAGLPGRAGEIKTVVRQSDRGRAISRAIRLARPGDTVVLAGKGHEDTQILPTGKIHFSDQEQARAALRSLAARG